MTATAHAALRESKRRTLVICKNLIMPQLPQGLKKTKQNKTKTK